MQETSKKITAYKGVLDFIIAILFLLLIGIWLFALVAMIMFCFTVSNPFFIQKRVGKNGKLFYCYKFKTVYHQPSKIVLLLSNKFLKKLNIDELPQIFNVLKGEMSIVGPRPHAISFHELYESYGLNLQKRLMVKPGITGASQILGFRGDDNNENINKQLIAQRIQFDEVYIKNQSLYIDLKIIAITFLQIFGCYKNISYKKLFS